MRSLSSLMLAGMAGASAASAFSFGGLGAAHGHGNHLVARASKGVTCKNGFVKAADKQSCVCPSDMFVSIGGTKCSASCASGSYSTAGTQACISCPDKTMKRCSSATVATACNTGYWLSAGQCVKDCPSATWADQRVNKNKCRPCNDPDATACTDGGHRSATACLTGYLYKGECLDADDVPAPYYPDTAMHTAKACSSGVASCTDATTATSCGKLNGKQLYLTSNYTCVEDCPSGSYDDPKLKACIKCDSTMLTCDANGGITCGKDTSGTQLYLTPSKTCILSWMGAYAGYYEDDASNSFKACDDGVTSCIGSGDGNALTCGKKLDGAPTYFVPTNGLYKRGATTYATLPSTTTVSGPLGSCVVADQCPDATYADDCTASCSACADGDASCSGVGAGTALSCKNGLYLTTDGNCVSPSACVANGAFFADDSTDACAMCGTGETSCTDNLPGSATGCGIVDGQQLYLYQGYCVASTACPGNYFADPVEKKCSPCAAYTNSCTSLTNALSCGVNDRSKQLYLNTVTSPVLTASNTTLTNSTLTNSTSAYCVTKDKCSAPTFADPGTRKCESCTLLDEDALYCSSPFVITCATKFYQNGECVESSACIEGTYGSSASHICASCSTFGSTVATCDASGALSCSSGLLENSACVSSCSAGNYQQDGSCLSCSTLFGDNVAQCTAETISQCSDDFLLQSNTCVAACDDGYYASADSTCLACTSLFPNSLTCSFTAVTSCQADYLEEGTTGCVSACNSGESPVDGVCTPCSGNAATCDTSGVVSCEADYYLLNESGVKSCVAQCPSTYYADGDSNCDLCSDNQGLGAGVNECSSSTVATSCSGDYVLYDDKCMDTVCPSGYRADDSNICQACSDTGAATCDGNGSLTCTGSLLLKDGACAEDCGKGYVGVDGVCQGCEEGAATCDPADLSTLTCVDDLFLLTTSSVKSCESACPTSTYIDGTSCVACTSSNYASCDATGATSCSESFFLLNGDCVAECGDAFVGVNGACQACGDNTASCDSSLSALTCEDTFYLLAGTDGDTCVSDCGDGNFVDGTSCSACTLDFATTCSSVTVATACETDHFLYNDQCYAGCPDASYANTDGLTCTACDSNYATCDANGALSCVGSLFLQDGDCLVECGEGYRQDGSTCKACSDEHASTCTESAATACQDGFVLKKGQCESSCDAGSYSDGSSCIDCAANVQTCDASGALSCSTDSFLKDSACITSCPDGTFGSTTSGSCEACDKSAATCSSTAALTCADNFWLSGTACVDACPTGTVAQGSTAADRLCATCDSIFTGSLTCTSSGPTTCSSSTYLSSDSSKCVAACGTNEAPTNGKCVNCATGDISSCDTSGALSCKNSKYLLTSTTSLSTCVSSGSCPTGTWATTVSNVKVCKACGTGVASCSTSGVARTCFEGFFFGNYGCGTSCPSGYGKASSGNVCAKCTDDSVSCDLGVVICKVGHKLLVETNTCTSSNSCTVVPDFSSGRKATYDGSNGTCKACASGDAWTLSCNSSGNAIACYKPSGVSTKKYLLNNQCVDDSTCLASSTRAYLSTSTAVFSVAPYSTTVYACSLCPIGKTRDTVRQTCV